MMQKKRGLLIFPLVLVFIFLGCAVRPYVKVVPQRIDGAFQGTLDDGESIYLGLSNSNTGWTGSGAVGAHQVVFLETNAATVAGTLVYSNGTVKPVLIDFSNSSNLLLELSGQTVSLTPALKKPAPDPGPLSGNFETKNMSSLLEAINLTQTGNMVTGTAVVLGKKALVKAWVIDQNSVHGTIVLPGGIEFEFEAGLDGENKLVVNGLGNSAIFQRK